MLLYAITSRRLLPGGEAEKRAGLVELARVWARGGVDYIQIREKDLPPPDLLALTRQIVTAVRSESSPTRSPTRILLNGPAEIALAAGADGVHLPGNSPAEAAGQARRLFRGAGREAIVCRACHSVEEVREAPDTSLIVFAPVFEKAEEHGAVAGVGVDALREVCLAAASASVIALGGITAANAAECVRARAAGVAGIRLFLSEQWRTLRSSPGLRPTSSQG